MNDYGLNPLEGFNSIFQLDVSIVKMYFKKKYLMGEILLFNINK